MASPTPTDSPTTESSSTRVPASTTLQLSSRSNRHFSNASNRSAGPSTPARPKSYSLSSNAHTQTSSNPHPAVRSLPTWIHSLSESPDTSTGYEDEPTAPSPVHAPPDSAFPAMRNFVPSSRAMAVFNKPRSPPPGRRHDHARSAAPVTPASSNRDTASRWESFAKVSAYPAVRPPAGGQRVDSAWLSSHGDYDSPWNSGHGGVDDSSSAEKLLQSKKARKAWYMRTQQALLRNPLVPLVFRLTIWSYSLVALALAASIYRSSKLNDFDQRPSTIIAIVVSSIASVYLLYITYDEYTSSPLGLRSPRAKMWLIFLDLFFIVFSSANLSLAFDTLTDIRGSCQNGPEQNGLFHKNVGLCHKQKGLAAMLLMVLVGWIGTFQVSVFRIVERGFRE